MSERKKKEKLSVFWWYRNDVNNDATHFRFDYVGVANAVA